MAPCLRESVKLTHAHSFPNGFFLNVKRTTEGHAGSGWLVISVHPSLCNVSGLGRVARESLEKKKVLPGRERKRPSVLGREVEMLSATAAESKPSTPPPASSTVHAKCKTQVTLNPFQRMLTAFDPRVRPSMPFFCFWLHLINHAGLLAGA